MCFSLKEVVISEYVENIDDLAFTILPFTEKIIVRSMNAEIGEFALCATPFMGVKDISIEDFIELYIQSQISDEKNDITYYELGKWVELLMRANPNALESLYIPKDKVVGDIHPAIQLFIDNREMFLTKECFKSLVGYAYTQIQKATGLNKKINWDVIERKDVLRIQHVHYK